MSNEPIRTPTSSTGIIRFYDVATGGPTMDPRAVVVFSVIFVALVKIISFLLNPA